MKLEFDSIGELEQFLMFTAHVGKAFQSAPVEPVKVTSEASSLADQSFAASVLAVDDGEQSIAHRAEQDARNEEFIAANVAANAEAPKRKRRTKAEIEAERAGELPNAPADGQTATSAEPSASESPLSSETATGTVPNGNPFAVAPTVQAVLDAPNQGAATLAAMAATQNATTAPQATGGTVQDRAAAIMLEPAAVESIAHLRACQGFIQKHGMTKYNESFKEGLNANIAAYQPEQRALHLAVLESLDA
jgi:hypothetical protein